MQSLSYDPWMHDAYWNPERFLREWSPLNSSPRLLEQISNSRPSTSSRHAATLTSSPHHFPKGYKGSNFNGPLRNHSPEVWSKQGRISHSLASCLHWQGGELGLLHTASLQSSAYVAHNVLLGPQGPGGRAAAAPDPQPCGAHTAAPDPGLPPHGMGRQPRLLPIRQRRTWQTLGIWTSL